MIVQVGGHRIQFPDDMPEADIAAVLQKHYPSRPNHDDLAGAAVTGTDSLDLQELDNTVKPVVKMTVPELMQSVNRIGDKPVFINAGTAYVLSPAVNASEAVQAILDGNDSEILGYPEKGDSDAAVTKDGEIVTDLPTMKEHADNGNVIWAANGEPEALQQKAERVVDAIWRGKKVKVSMPEDVHCRW